MLIIVRKETGEIHLFLFMYISYAYKCYTDTGVPDITNPTQSDVNAYTIPTVYDAYFDMFLSQHFSQVKQL